MSSKWPMSCCPASLSDWKDEDLEDFELVSSGGEPGDVDIVDAWR